MDESDPVSAPTPFPVKDLRMLVVILLAGLVTIGWFVIDRFAR